MITAKLDFACKLCGQKQSWYIMPLKEKVGKNGSFINSLNKYNIQCKKCGKNYLLKFTIRTV